MTLRELRRFLNTLPLNSDDWPVVALDVDTAELYDGVKLSIGDAGALVVGIQIQD